jgi:hypothetical protein
VFAQQQQQQQQQEEEGGHPAAAATAAAAAGAAAPLPGPDGHPDGWVALEMACQAHERLVKEVNVSRPGADGLSRRTCSTAVQLTSSCHRGGLHPGPVQLAPAFVPLHEHTVAFAPVVAAMVTPLSLQSHLQLCAESASYLWPALHQGWRRDCCVQHA